MIRNEMKNELVMLEGALQSKAAEYEEGKSVYSMFADVARQCLVQLEKMDQITEDTQSGEAIIGETISLLKEYVEMPFKLLTSKRCYEEFDDLMADFDDWIESMNELLEDNNELLLYMESWNIGVFFE